MAFMDCQVPCSYVLASLDITPEYSPAKHDVIMAALIF